MVKNVHPLDTRLSGRVQRCAHPWHAAARPSHGYRHCWRLSGSVITPPPTSQKLSIIHPVHLIHFRVAAPRRKHPLRTAQQRQTPRALRPSDPEHLHSDTPAVPPPQPHTEPLNPFQHSHRPTGGHLRLGASDIMHLIGDRAHAKQTVLKTHRRATKQIFTDGGSGACLSPNLIGTSKIRRYPRTLIKGEIRTLRLEDREIRIQK